MPLITTPTQHDAAYFDFVEGLKRHNYRETIPKVLDRYHAAARDRVVATMADAGEILERDVLFQVASGVQRTSQEMAWFAAALSVTAGPAAYSEDVDDTGTSARLELDPDLELPDWYFDAASADLDDIHLQPYWGSAYVGAIYERGGGLYRTAWRGGYGKQPAPLVAFAASAPRDDYRDVLDLGCAFGSSTIAFRLAYPDAERVVGIDLSEDALKWAYLVAAEKDLEITYSQRNTADTGYESESFDLITGFLVLHEMPAASVEATLAEAFRLLRPGGSLMFLDIPRYGVLDPEVAYIQSYDQRGNGERYWDEFLSRDLPSVLRAVGFVDVEEGPLDFAEPGYWGSAALMRTGKFEAVNRWVTKCTKLAGGDK